MEYIGKYYGFDTYYLDLTCEDYNHVLPRSNWFGFTISNTDFDDSEDSLINKFYRKSIDNEILAFHSQGLFGGKLHMTMDLLITKIEINDKHSEIDISTTGDNETDLTNGFWGCYGASCLPDISDFDTVQLVCTSIDGINYKDELKSLLQRFNKGYLPSDN